MAENTHLKFMKEAIKEAKKGLKEGGIPIGSVLVEEGKVIGRGHNLRVQKGSEILHAEMACIENAGRKNEKELKNCTLYSTLSPCEMCSGTIILYKISAVVIGENKTFEGPEEYMKKKGIEIINLDLKECKGMMADFIRDNKKLWNEDIGK